MNVSGLDPKEGSKYAHIVTTTYDEPKMDQIFIFSINKLIEMEGLDCLLLCSMQCCMSDDVIDKVPKFLSPVPSETKHAIQIVNAFSVTHPMIESRMGSKCALIFATDSVGYAYSQRS